jgi:putative holliday junction resolvase
VRALALDIGTKTIGLAVTDEASIAAHPLPRLSRTATTSDVSAIQTRVAELDITDVIVGMPYELSGRVGHRARQVQQFAQAIRAALPPAITLHEQDERFTTAEAERVLLSADVSRARRREVIDSQAAVLILQAWLDARSRSK